MKNLYTDCVQVFNIVRKFGVQMFWKKAFTARELRRISWLAHDPQERGRVQYLWYSKLRKDFVRAMGELDRDARRQVLASICQN